MPRKRNAGELYSGFVIEFEPSRANTLAEWLAIGHDISDSFSSDDWSLGKKEVFFILSPRGDETLPSANGESFSVLCAAYVERMHGTGGTRKPKYRIARPVIFGGHIRSEEIGEPLVELKRSVSNQTRGRRLSPGLWERLVSQVSAVRPSSAGELAELLALVDRDTELLGGTNRLDRLAEQRDAVGMVLDVAGLDRSEEMKLVDASKADAADTFFDLLTTHALQERSLIEHDQVWLQELLAGAGDERVYSDPSSSARVTVRITDKTPLETALGVDLLIYQSLYNSLIFVQYKAMNREGDSGWTYRPDSQLDIQLAAMDVARVALKSRSVDPIESRELRLNDEAFYFKLCERRKPDAAEASLVSGMSLTAPHLQQFLKMPEAQGPKGGIQIGYKNCFRYFNNTEFITLAKGGWIGTSAQGSEFIKEVVRASLEGNRALVYALIEIPEKATAELRKTRK
jgi:hypothetical protein